MLVKKKKMTGLRMLRQFVKFIKKNACKKSLQHGKPWNPIISLGKSTINQWEISRIQKYLELRYIVPYHGHIYKVPSLVNVYSLRTWKWPIEIIFIVDLCMKHGNFPQLCQRLPGRVGPSVLNRFQFVPFFNGRNGAFFTAWTWTAYLALPWKFMGLYLKKWSAWLVV